MKITYAENPLLTTVELDDHEKQLFRYKLMVKELIDNHLFTAHFYLTQPDMLDVERAKQAVDPDYYLGDEDGDDTAGSKLEKRVDSLLEHYLEELQSSHCGDCTCVAMSCSKCHAEGILGIDTLKPYPGKHQLHKIDGAFRYKDGEEWRNHSIEEAIAKLESYDPKLTDPDTSPGWAKVGGFEAHVPRWKAEAASALAWLKNYRDTHFPKEQA